MNAKTVAKLLVGLGLAEDTFHVKGERAGTLRAFDVTLYNEADHGRAAEVKAAVLKLIEDKGFGGTCTVLPKGPNPLGKVLA